MVKRREPPVTATTTTATAEAIEAFAAGADGGKHQTKPDLDPNANRDYKAIRVPFNQYEFEKLEELAKKTGRTKLNVIRWAILKMAEEQHQ
jgi:predicted transcriptional regulator